MPLILYFHPLSSYCHKALIALYEHDVAFTSLIVDLGDPASRAAFAAIWPMAKMPVLRDEARGCTIAESTIVIEYLDAFYRGARALIPADADLAWRTRLWDRFFDNYVHTPMQKVVTDMFRPAGVSDAFGVDLAVAQIRQACRILEPELAGKTWILGEDFTLADCAAAPALFYANLVAPFGADDRNLAAYLGRLMARPSFARALREAAPYFPMFPLDPKPSLGPMS